MMSATAEKKPVLDHVPARERRKTPLGDAVQTALELYFKDLDGHYPSNLFNMVIHEVERPLLAAVMNFARGNQSKAAEMLGISRSTLRKKLAFHSLDK